ncbi:MAG: hypothetical protein INR71_05080 [Terriglobus roseus]|nr:hypothetical protein [Terriglobus roseus]
MLKLAPGPPRMPAAVRLPEPPPERPLEQRLEPLPQPEQQPGPPPKPPTGRLATLSAPSCEQHVAATPRPPELGPLPSCGTTKSSASISH